MSPELPALLAATGAVVLTGLPAPARLDVLRPVAAVHRRQAPSWVLPTLTGVTLLLVSGVVAAAGGMVAAVLGRRAWRRRQLVRRREQERAGAGEALAVLVAELRAGRPPGVALAAAAEVAAGPLAEAFAAAARSDSFGADPVACLLSEAPHSAVPELLRGLAACWAVCGSTGSSLASAVDLIAEGARAQHAHVLAVEAELAGPRASAAMLAALPLAGLALAAGLGARPLQVLLHTPVGIGCTVVGTGLELLGLWWTGRIVAAAGGER